MTRGTDPHIFLVRALLGVGLTDKDITPVLLQHADGKTALIRGDVDAWAGLDPMMAQAEVEDGAKLFYPQQAEANTWGILNVREEFLKDHPDLVQRVLAVYEEARKYSLANYDELKKRLHRASPSCRTRWSTSSSRSAPSSPTTAIGAPQRDSILAAGLALQQAGVIKADVDVKATVDALIDDRSVAADELTLSGVAVRAGWLAAPQRSGASRAIRCDAASCRRVCQCPCRAMSVVDDDVERRASRRGDGAAAAALARLCAAGARPAAAGRARGVLGTRGARSAGRTAGWCRRRR